MPFATPTADSALPLVHYTDTAEPGKPAVVLLHGTGGDVSNWDLLVPALAPTHRVIAVDLAGAGRTPLADHALTLDDLTAQVLAVVDHARIDRFSLVGHSLGAVLAAAVAAHEGGRVDALVLQAGWVWTNTEMAAIFHHWKLLLATGGTELLADALLLQAFGAAYWDHADEHEHRIAAAQFADALAPGTEQLIDLDLRVDIRAQLPAIGSRTLIVQSNDDRIIPVCQRRELERALPAATVVELDAGHAAPATCADEFAELVTAHLLQPRERLADRSPDRQSAITCGR